MITCYVHVTLNIERCICIVVAVELYGVVVRSRRLVCFYRRDAITPVYDLHEL